MLANVHNHILTILLFRKMVSGKMLKNNNTIIIVSQIKRAMLSLNKE